MTRVLRPVRRSVQSRMEKVLEQMHRAAELVEPHDEDAAALVLRHREELEQDWRQSFYVDDEEADR
jgi:hypothetical protein